MFIWVAISLLIIIADQITKYFVLQNVSMTETIPIVSGFLNLVYVKNPGAAFSMLADKTYLLSVISIVVCFFLIWFLVTRTEKSKLLTVSVAMILGGAVGNLIDRLLRGYVVDYIELCFVNFPVFNLADIAITCGAILLMIYVIFFDGNKNKQDDK